MSDREKVRNLVLLLLLGILAILLASLAMVALLMWRTPAPEVVVAEAPAVVEAPAVDDVFIDADAISTASPEPEVQIYKVQPAQPVEPGGDGPVPEAPPVPEGTTASVDLAVLGALDQAQVQNVLSRGTASLHRCYQEALEKTPDLAGAWTGEILVQPSGAVGRVRTVDTTLADPAVSDCLVTRLKRARFPGGRGTATITWTLRFQPS